MFEFKLVVDGEVVYENSDPREAFDSVEVSAPNTAITTIALKGVGELQLDFKRVSFANRPYDYVAILDSEEYKTAVADFEAELDKVDEAVQPTPSTATVEL